jgi:hypothetical protein
MSQPPAHGRAELLDFPAITPSRKWTCTCWGSPKSRSEILRGGGSGRREHIAKDILHYLLRHPAAADTFDGIARWRVLEEIAQRSVASTEDAMRWLIAKGFLSEVKIGGGQSLYRLNPDRREEAESLVKASGPQPPDHRALPPKS